MDRQWSINRYSTRMVEDRVDGYSGLELMLLRGGTSEYKLIARILYWDACGQFYFETLGHDVPIDILEELIAEAKNSIKTK